VEKVCSESKNGKKELDNRVVGKYFDTGDFMLSDCVRFCHRGSQIFLRIGKTRGQLDLDQLKDYEQIQKKVSGLKKYDGIIVPGGFGESGIEGVIMAIKYARENKIPYLGLLWYAACSYRYSRSVLG